jgi:hypothetical protein
MLVDGVEHGIDHADTLPQDAQVSSAEGLAEYVHLAIAWEDVAGQRAGERRFATAVGPKQCHALAALDLTIDAAQNHLPAALHVQVMGLDGWRRRVGLVDPLTHRIPS